MDERKTIKKKKFLKKEVVEDLQEWVGMDVNMSEEFDALDKSGKGKITFEEVTHWALMKNVKIEFKKQQNLVMNSGEKNGDIE